MNVYVLSLPCNINFPSCRNSCLNEISAFWTPLEKLVWLDTNKNPRGEIETPEQIDMLVDALDLHPGQQCDRIKEKLDNLAHSRTITALSNEICAEDNYELIDIFASDIVEELQPLLSATKMSFCAVQMLGIKARLFYASQGRILYYEFYISQCDVEREFSKKHQEQQKEEEE